MLKPFIICASLLGSMYASADTVEVAVDLYSKRGEDSKNASKAAAIYEALADAEKSKIKKAGLMVSESEALYYYGSLQDSNSIKLTIHKKGEETAEEAASLLAGDLSAKTLRARAIYFYGSNRGQWALAKGGLQPLRLFNKEFKESMQRLISLDETVEDYGVYRILGLANIKVPRTFGGKDKKGLAQLEKAFEATKVVTEDYTVSKNATTTRYYLYALMSNKKTEQFCKVANDFYVFSEDEDREVQDAMNPTLIPENQAEIENFLEPEEDSDQEEIVEYYNDKNC